MWQHCPKAQSIIISTAFALLCADTVICLGMIKIQDLFNFKVLLLILKLESLLSKPFRGFRLQTSCVNEAVLCWRDKLLCWRDTLLCPWPRLLLNRTI